MHLQATPETRRVQREFPCLNQRPGKRQRKEDVGFSDIVVIEEVGSAGLKRVYVQRPAAVRDADAELVFLVSFPVQGRKRQGLAIRKVEERSCRGN